MCGIAGFLWSQPVDKQLALDALVNMREELKHRGPDDAGLWIDETSTVFLAHRRLAILDISSAGNQPMVSRSGKYTICFNGEIYNHLDLRAQLGSVAFRGGSDTETLLACIETWGLKKTLSKCVGMFALSLWDRDRRELTLARDRFGEKPLYYGWQDDCFLFASELKALVKHPKFLKLLNLRVIPSFLRLGYVPAPESIWRHIYKLNPGGIARIKADSNVGSVQIEEYWSMTEAVERAQRSKFSGTYIDAVDELECRLTATIRQQMISDVPIGVFLSGGVDSATVASLMAQCASSPLKTFTIGFKHALYNEAPYAMKVAQHLGSVHEEHYISIEEIKRLLSDLPSIYDEPFADSSQIPTVLLSQLAGRAVRVALTGDGGDELFAGYNRYFHVVRHYSHLNRIPLCARKVIGTLGKGIMELTPPSDRLRKLVAILEEEHIERIYRHYQWMSHAQITKFEADYAPYYSSMAKWPKIEDSVSKLMLADANTYLPDDLLVKVDRGAMSASLETRAPFLSHELFEYCWSLPSDFKCNRGTVKRILKDVLRKHLPSELFERRKMGFAVPISEWLKCELFDYSEARLNKQALKTVSFLDSSVINRMWREHLDGRRDHSASLWNLITLVSWLDHNQVAC
jgi:asparagine synthase (glutamine-hydrolysing)